MEKYLECARITTTHGVKGAVRLENRCDSPTALARLKAMYIREKDGSFRKLTVASASVQKQMVLASFKEIVTMEDAIALRDTVLYADRADIPLPKGAHFIADLLGLPVLDDESGKILGTMEDVICPAGQDIYVVRRAVGDGTFMIPAVPAFVKHVDTESDTPAVRVTLIEGMMDE